MQYDLLSYLDQRSKITGNNLKKWTHIPTSSSTTKLQISQMSPFILVWEDPSSAPDKSNHDLNFFVNECNLTWAGVYNPPRKQTWYLSKKFHGQNFWHVRHVIRDIGYSRKQCVNGFEMIFNQFKALFYTSLYNCLYI